MKTMTTQINLTLPQAAYEQLYEVASGKKAQVRVNREDLLHLLLDHGIILGALTKSTSFKVNEPVAHRARPRLKAP